MEFRFPTRSRRAMSDDESGLTAKQKGRLAALRSAKEVLGEDASSKDVRDLADYILGESDESVPALVDTEEPDEEDEDVEETEEDDSADDDGEDDDDAEAVSYT